MAGFGRHGEHLFLKTRFLRERRISRDGQTKEEGKKEKKEKKELR